MNTGLFYFNVFGAFVIVVMLVQVLAAMQQLGLSALAGNREDLTLSGFAGHIERALNNSLIALVMIAPRGLAGLALADPGEERAALDDMRSRWPRAAYVEDYTANAETARRIFDAKLWSKDQPLRIVLIGTDFEVRVWEKLLTIPMGKLATYSDIASHIGSPKASRAVGAAVGKNPISFVVPCHRAIGKSGDITGYHWGLTRKRAMLGWEAGVASGA